MPKLKTHKGAKSRFKVTATGKILRTKGRQNHRMKKSGRVQRELNKMVPLDSADRSRVKRALPYGA